MAQNESGADCRAITPEEAEEIRLAEDELLRQWGMRPQPFLRMTEEGLREIVREEIHLAMRQGTPELSLPTNLPPCP